MKKQVLYFVFGIFIILLSTPLGYAAISIVYASRNLTGEYVPMLNGFIHSFMLIGTLLFIMGLVELLSNKK